MCQGVGIRNSAHTIDTPVISNKLNKLNKLNYILK